ncbi:excinuclease ABC subunit UvrC [Acidobacteria bacterium AH-259-D05]|nr:excinuclease ABC subunit UvrC [Acidobacteria bacterium AH-259-D05]
MLEQKLDTLPNKPGVYLFKDSRQRVIYIGKAKSLRHRVRSYFQFFRNLDQKTQVLKQHIQDLDYIVTDNELEALFLESNLVKQQRPKFNVNLKDDKAFLHIKLTVNEPYPQVVLTRRVLDDGALYFGPFLPASLARNTIKIINRHFLLRTCTLDIDGNLDRPCLEYYIQRCLGPCVGGLCTQEGYSQAVKDVILFLEGKNQELIRNLTQKMMEASEKQHYEAAAFYRDRIGMLRDLTEKQKAIQGGQEDVDIFAYYREENCLALQLFTLRGGRIVGKREFYWEDLDFLPPSQFLRDALQQYYLTAGFIPHQIYLPIEIEDQELMGQWLSHKLQEKSQRRRVRIVVPKRGKKRDLLLLVEKNAKIAFETRFKILTWEKEKLLEHLQRELDLPELPQWIEAFDVSNIQGAESVASLVVCEGGVMRKNRFRKYKIKTVQGPDDVLSIYEVVHRRYRRLLAEEAPLPDLILIDGGKGQLHSAYQALSKLGIEDIPLASIAKREEVIFVQGREDPVLLPSTSPVLHLIQEIRDEAHRFALAYHRKRRSLRDFHSELDQISGIGEKRKKRLLRNFGSVAKIRQATVEELAPLVGRKLARRLKQELTG